MLHANIMSGSPSEISEYGDERQTASLISGPQRPRVEVNAIELGNQIERKGKNNATHTHTHVNSGLRGP